MSYSTTILNKAVRLSLMAVLTMFICPDSEAAKEAIVVTNKAVVYSSPDLKAPIGYVVKGKRVMLGETPINRGQFYPIVVAGKIAYLRSSDVSFELDANQNLVASRFYEVTKENYSSYYSLGIINYSSSYESPISGMEEAFSWFGYQLKGDATFGGRWSVQILTTGMWGTKGEEQFRSIELGVGGSYMVLELRKLRVNLFAQFLGIPFASYAVGTQFRVNGGGFGGGLGLSSTFDMGKRWGIEGSFGVYQTRLTGFDTPEDYEAPNPQFSGARTVLSAYYRF